MFSARVDANNLVVKHPPPKPRDEFEDIVLAAAKLRFDSPDFFRNGRQGQARYGVDGWVITMASSASLFQNRIESIYAAHAAVYIIAAIFIQG